VNGTGWKVGARFSKPIQTRLGAHPASYAMGTRSLAQGVKRPGHGTTTHTHLELRLKKQYKTSTSSVGLHGLL